MKRIAFFVLFLLIPSMAFTTMARKNVPLDRLVTDANYAFVGKCISVKPDKTPGMEALNPYKMTFQLEQISFMKGSKEYKVGDEFVAKVAGLKGVPTCVKGTSSFWLFAKESPIGFTAPMNLSGGVFPIDVKTQKVKFGSNKSTLFKGVSTRNPSAGKSVGKATTGDMTASELVDLVKQLKESKSGK